MSELEKENTSEAKKTSVMDNYKFINADDYSEEELKSLAKLYTESFRDIKEGEIIKGKIVGISGDNVVLDVGFKSDGTISRNEFTSTEELKLGEEVDIVIESVEDEEGNLILSKKRADFLKIWGQIMDAYEQEKIIPGKILKRIKGGMVVDLLGIEAFLPGSQIDIRPVRDFDAFVGQTMDFKIVKINVPTENVVVSHKVLIEETIADQRKEILDGLEKGQILEGIVKAITDFGVFVDLGGVDGLVHITDLSWGRINHPSEVVKLDESIKVVVTDFDKERKRISLSLKQLLPHPWEEIDQKYKIGDKVSGRVVSLTDYGAFIEIEKGIEGLIHISEMSWTQHISHPSQFVSMGQVVEAVILSLDKNEKKISLGMKQLTPDPWQELLKKYPVGSKQKGVARNLTNFGVFVELEPGIDGLIHISDLSWTKKIRHPGEVVKKGEEIEVVVLGVDTEQRKISLGHKQVEENPWTNFEREYAVGKSTEGKVVRIIEKGVIAELPLGVDGFIPQTQLSTNKVKNLALSFPVDTTLPLKVVEFDKENKKIVLSVLAALKEKDDQTIEEYINTHKLEKVTVDDIKNADAGKFDSSDFNLYDEAGNDRPREASTPQITEAKETSNKKNDESEAEKPEAESNKEEETKE
ncbi:MAG: 30S ribosomal protein S1 [Melioribacteraceae bacterium]|nr:30S ribosomal protein S1 [Melioribacteraceae bacterium]MDD3557416.1 30S ribosomal protein S1 [Melioribacteraceae bacterium]